jgi:hypothetical protein
MINLSIPQVYLSTVRGGENLVLRSHAYSFKATPGPVASMLPQNIVKMGSVKVSIIGALTPPQAATIARQYDARPSSVIAALNWLVAHNSSFAGVSVSDVETVCNLVNSSTLEADSRDASDFDFAMNRHSQSHDDLSGSTLDGDAHLEKANILSNVSPILDQDGNLDHLQIRRSSQFLSDYDRSYWTTCFAELFPFGHGGLDVDRSVQVSEYYFVKKLLRLSSGAFRKHFSFGLVAFDVLSRHAASQSVFYRVKANPQLSMRSVSVTREELEAQLLYDKARLDAYEKHKPLPPLPEGLSNVFSLKNAISVGQCAMWGTAEERKKAQRQALAMTKEFGQPSIMFTICPESTSSFRILEMSDGVLNNNFNLDINSTDFGLATIREVLLPQLRERQSKAASDPASCAR